MSTNVNTIRDLAERDYKWGFVTDIEHEQVPKGSRIVAMSFCEPRSCRLQLSS